MFLGFDLWPLKFVWGWKKYTIRKPIYDFLFDFYGNHLSILYRFRIIRLQNCQGLTLTFDVWRSSEVEKNNTIRKLIYDFLFDCIDNTSLSRTVFEIFDFKVFMVWPWPLTPKSHLGSKKCMLFESPYMTSYLTSIDNISPSRTIFQIFDFKVFRVWLWPSTPKGHLGSKKIIPFESSYMTSYLTSMDTISLSRIVLEIFDFKVSRVWPWHLTPKGHLGSRKNYTIREPIYDFLFDFYEHHLSIS